MSFSVDLGLRLGSTNPEMEAAEVVVAILSRLREGSRRLSENVEDEEGVHISGFRTIRLVPMPDESGDNARNVTECWTGRRARTIGLGAF
jgi:hypothetical protein